ncbi:hypothetical protein KM176_05480 [Pseudooceanicola sp. CBS1P-1]|uniref:Uncharacterized protein n=1 Tax=Pseudooceanicola albus TaxID=2692189 RepID=A0A6L7FW85_9RHOB|nr:MULTISPECIES: hypothetical protein [Pseudooceanicola]MBT9383303.1 hypothetical protein [Pseudooceanicola endophyticus]MXN16374.1 hypothetical protein [Pseudooceanicola albus]
MTHRPEETPMYDEYTRLKEAKDKAQRIADETDNPHLRRVCRALATEMRKMLRGMRQEFIA